MLNDFIHLVEGLRGHPYSLPIFISTYVAACFVAPISLFPVAGGVLFGFQGGMAANLIAALLGATGPFFIARRLGQGVLTRFLNRWRHRDMAARLRNPAPLAFIVVRLLGVPPFVVTNYLAGLSHMRYRQFLWTSAVGLLPWTFLMTYFSHTLWGVLVEAGLQGFRRAVSDHARPLIGGAVVMAVLMVGGMALSRWSGGNKIPPPNKGPGNPG